jgi:hypothetical protein
MGWHRADLGQNGFRFGGWVREVDMYLLAQDRTSAGRDSLEMNVYVLFCRAVLRFRTGVLSRRWLQRDLVKN